MEQAFKFYLFVCLIILGCKSEAREYCEHEKFIAECNSDEVIVMESARYGRMKTGHCIKLKEMIGCSIDATTYLNMHCSGKRSCEVAVIEVIPDHQVPCSRDYRNYLEASYRCQKVIATERCSSQSHVLLEENKGYLSSSLARTTGVGRTQCPWKIKLPQGQHVKFTLLDFNTEEHQRIAIINEEPRQFDVYGGIKSQKMVYRSETNEVDAHITAQDDERFLLLYESIGCPDVQAPEDGWVSRSGDVLEWGCKETGDTQTIHCIGDKWKGTVGNCTQNKPEVGETTAVENVENQGFGFQMSQNAIITVFLVSVSLLFGAISLVGGLMCYFRCKKKKAERMGFVNEVHYNTYRKSNRTGTIYQNHGGLQSHTGTLISKGNGYFAFHPIPGTTLTSRYPDIPLPLAPSGGISLQQTNLGLRPACDLPYSRQFSDTLRTNEIIPYGSEESVPIYYTLDPDCINSNGGTISREPPSTGDSISNV